MAGVSRPVKVFRWPTWPGDGATGRGPSWQTVGMASPQTHERRILALEARVADIDRGYGETLYKLHRASVKTDLRMARMLDRLGIADVSDEDVDAALDES